VAWDDTRIGSILENDSNLKYIHYIDEYILDQGNKFGTTFKVKP
jgi:hypothetical protein